MFKYTFKFTLTFTSMFLLEIITWIPYILGSWNLVCYLPRPKLQLCARVAPGSSLGVRQGVQSVGAFVYFGHMSSLLGVFFVFLFKRNVNIFFYLLFVTGYFALWWHYVEKIFYLLETQDITGATRSWKWGNHLFCFWIVASWFKCQIALDKVFYNQNKI